MGVHVTGQPVAAGGPAGAAPGPPRTAARAPPRPLRSLPPLRSLRLAAADETSWLAQLRKLAQLHEEGVLSDAHYETAKRRILDQR